MVRSYYYKGSCKRPVYLLPFLSKKQEGWKTPSFFAMSFIINLGIGIRFLFLDTMDYNGILQQSYVYDSPPMSSQVSL